MMVTVIIGNHQQHSNYVKDDDADPDGSTEINR